MMVLALLLVLAGTAGAAVAAWRLDGGLADAGALVLRSEARLAELRRGTPGQIEIEDVQAVAEDGARLVQAVHRGIASVPFAILEALPPTRPVTRVVRTAHDLIADGVYGAISAGNRGLGKLLRKLDEPPKSRS